MSGDPKDMAVCQLVSMLYDSVSACSELSDERDAVKAEHDRLVMNLAAKLAEAEKAKADVSANYNVLRSEFRNTHDTICELENQVDQLREQLTAANQRIADLEGSS